MKIINKTLIIIAGFLLSYSVYGETVEFRPKFVGIATIMGTDATLESTGMTKFEINEKSIDATDWHVDSILKQEITNAVDNMGIKTEVVSLPDNEKEEIAKVLSKLRYFETVKPVGSLKPLIKLAQSKGMDSLLVVIPRAAQIPNTSQILEGYGILYISDRYYLNRPLSIYLHGSAYLIDVGKRGIFKTGHMGAGARINLKKKLTADEKRKIKLKVEEEYADSEGEDLDWILEDMLNVPHHTMSTYSELPESEKKKIISLLQDSIKSNTKKIIPKLFDKEIVTAWEDDF
jgi:hypothetical protein